MGLDHRSKRPRIVTGARLMFCGLLLTGVGGELLAQTPAPTTALRLGQLYRSVQTANPRIAAAGALAQAAEARVAPRRRPPDPELQLGLMNRSLPGLELDPVLGMNELQLMQMLPFPGKLRAAGDVAIHFMPRASCVASVASMSAS